MINLIYWISLVGYGSVHFNAGGQVGWGEKSGIKERGNVFAKEAYQPSEV